MPTPTPPHLPASGTCYATALASLISDPRFNASENWLLAHGRPTLTVEPFCEYGHAWLQNDYLSLCYNSETNQIIPTPVFYMVGKINPINELNFYTKNEAVMYVNRLGVAGPWEGVDYESAMQQLMNDNAELN